MLEKPYRNWPALRWAMTPALIRLVALAAAMSLLVPSVAVADGEWGEDGRALDIEWSSDRFELRSDRVAGDVHDEIRLRLDGSNVRFDFELRESPGATEAEAGIRLELERVIEFRDANGDGAFQASDDVRGEYDQGDLELVSLTSGPASSGGIDGIEVTATYNFTNKPGSELAFRATAFGNVTTFQGLPQRPVDVKLDLVLTDFLEENDTLPAIELKVAAEAPGGPNVTTRDVSFTSGNLTGVFSWKDVADVDGVERPVRTTAVRLPDEVEGGEVEVVLSLTFAYARGANITHDPTFGFDLATVATVVSLLGHWGFYALGAGLAAVVFASLALARRGRKAKGK